MTDKIEDEGLHPEDFGPPLGDPAGLDPRKRRRRGLIWAAVLMLLGGLLGAWLGWSSEEPVYRGEAMIYIAPSMPSPEDPAGVATLPMFKGFLAYQVALTKSRRTTLLAMEADGWKATGQPSRPQYADAFEARRRIVHPEESQHIQLHFYDPDSEVALEGVRALIHAYLLLSEDLNDANESLEYARTRTEILTSRIKAGNDQILTFTAEYGGLEGLEIRHRAAIHRVLSTEASLEALRNVIADHGRTQGEESATMGQLKARERGLLTHLEHLQATSRKLGRVRMDVTRLQAGDEDLRGQMQKLQALRDQLTSQMVGKGRVTIADPGTMPTEYFRDDRSAAAKTWAGIGALPGLLVLLASAWRGRRSKRATAAA